MSTMAADGETEEWEIAIGSVNIVRISSTNVNAKTKNNPFLSCLCLLETK